MQDVYKRQEKVENIREDYLFIKSERRYFKINFSSIPVSYTHLYHCSDMNTLQHMPQASLPAFGQLQKRLDLLYPGHYLLENQYDHQSSCTTNLKLM